MNASPRALTALLAAGMLTACLGDDRLQFRRLDPQDARAEDMTTTARDQDVGPSPDLAEVDLPPQQTAPAYRAEDGTLVIEAEHFRSQRPGLDEALEHQWALMADPPEGASQQAMRALPNADLNAELTTLGPRMDYRVWLPAGEYRVWVRMWADSGSNNSVHVGLDHEASTLARWGMRLPPRQRNIWAWTGVISDDMGEELALLRVEQEGIHQINIWMREDGSILDKFMLTQDLERMPQGTGPAESLLR